jgi:hypothetical protein
MISYYAIKTMKIHCIKLQFIVAIKVNFPYTMLHTYATHSTLNLIECLTKSDDSM